MEHKIIYRHWLNKLIWLTLPSIYIETIFHIFRVDHFLCSAVTEGKTKHMSPLRREENIPKVILTDSKSCAAGRDSGNDRGTCREGGSDARETAGVWKAPFAVPIIALCGGWGGAQADQARLEQGFCSWLGRPQPAGIEYGKTRS